MKIVEGNLLDLFDEGIFKYIAHQVNCQGVMGSGIAKQIKKRYPMIFEGYQDFIEVQENDTIGLASIDYVDDGRYVIQLYGQRDYGKGDRHTNYSALASALVNAVSQISGPSYTNPIYIGIPYKMSCGLGGGDWSIVTLLLEDLEKIYNVEFIAVKLPELMDDKI